MGAEAPYSVQPLNLVYNARGFKGLQGPVQRDLIKRFDKGRGYLAMRERGTFFHQKPQYELSLMCGSQFCNAKYFFNVQKITPWILNATNLHFNAFHLSLQGFSITTSDLKHFTFIFFINKQNLF